MPIRPENRLRYPRDWREISYRVRAFRARWQCECDGRCGSATCLALAGRVPRCPARHDEPHPVTGSRVVLTVAHLDHTPEHCDPSNLAAMCQACHLAYDREHHARTAAATRAAALAEQMDTLPGLDTQESP